MQDKGELEDWIGGYRCNPKSEVGGEVLKIGLHRKKRLLYFFGGQYVPKLEAGGKVGRGRSNIK